MYVVVGGMFDGIFIRQQTLPTTTIVLCVCVCVENVACKNWSVYTQLGEEHVTLFIYIHNKNVSNYTIPYI